MNFVTLPRILRGTLSAFALLLAITSTSAQINLSITTVAGSWPSEVGWELVNTGTNVVYSCLAPGSTPLNANNTTISVPAGNYEFRSWDSFGDGWNGATYTLKYQSTGVVLLNAITMASGGGVSNKCTGTPTDYTTTKGQLLAKFAVVAPCSVPTITASPSDVSACTGTTVNFTVTSNMTSGTYEWRKDGVTLATTRSNVYTVSPVTASSAGFYDVVLRDDCNPTVATNTSGSGRLVVSIAPTITQNLPSTRGLCVGQNDTLRIRALATGRSFQWRFNGSPIAGATDSNYIIVNAGLSAIGTYDCIVSGSCTPSVTSVACAVDVAFSPVVSQHPSDQTVCPGSTVTLSTAGSVVGGTLTYQWLKNGSPISGANSPTLTLSNIQSTDVGRYYCNLIRVGANPSNCNVVTGCREVTVSVFSAPRISQQPVSVEGCVGGTATLAVAADGFDVSYQWFKNGVAVAGATSNSLAFTALTPANAGNYTVRVSGSCGFSVTSAAATLSVVSRPTFTQMPVGASLLIGQPLTLSVAGTGITTVKWMKNNVAIAGATALTYTIPSVTLADAGSYSALISNSCGSVVSGYAVVKVVDPTTLVPELTLSQATVDAGDVPAEYNRTIVLTNFITNTGKAPLTVTSVSVENASGTGTFAISNGGATPFTLAPGEMHSVGLTFTAPSVGASSATLVVNSDDPAGAKSAMLSGMGVLNYNAPTTLSFGKVTINSGLQKCFDVTNASASPVTIDQAQLSGANASLFTVITSLPTTIAAGATTQLCVKYTPAALGDHSAVLKIISSNGGNTQLALSGNGDDPTSVIDVATAGELSVYPNPAAAAVNVSGSLVRDGAAVSLVNAMGSVVVSLTANDNALSIDAAALPAGLYTVVVRSGHDARFLRLAIVR